jgi:hypothetical protein
MCGSAFSKAEHLRGNTRPKSSDTVYSSPSFLQIWPFSKYPQLTVLSMDHPAIQAVSEFIINSTISFDGSVGRKAEEDIQLASFGKRLIFEPGEPDASEKTPSKPRSPSPPPRAAHEGRNHALQDYQMQLMLLEQQNKKRLMAARQEQDAANIFTEERFKHIPAQGPVLRAPVSHSSLSMLVDDGEEVISGDQKVEAHVGIVQGDGRLDGFCLPQESGIGPEARSGKRRRVATAKSAHWKQPEEVGGTERVSENFVP